MRNKVGSQAQRSAALQSCGDFTLSWEASASGLQLSLTKVCCHCLMVSISVYHCVKEFSCLNTASVLTRGAVLSFYMEQTQAM